MVNRKTDAVIMTAFAVATVVSLHVAEAFVDDPPAPTVEITTKAIQSTQVSNVVPAPTTPSVILYDVPLATELQLHIIQVAESYGIDPAIIFAMIYRESSYNPTSVGDHGAAFGLMQIQPRWHSARMARLGCTDLLDPYQNVIVGTDYLAEQLTRYGGDMRKALVAYNAGHYSGTITMYAQVVIEMAEELRGTIYEPN